MTIVCSIAQPCPVALFISDLHLSELQPRTTQAFFDFLQQRASQVQELYILGDLFEYWAGDDDLDNPYNKSVVDALRLLNDSGVQIFWIAGNRDFLIGAAFAHATGLKLLPDPFIASIGNHRITLTHGDAQCTDDTAYMAFRQQVRQAQWQTTFLSLPLSQRKTIIAGLRNDSRQAKSTKSYDIMDVNALAIDDLFAATGTAVMIHGHTHRPARHESVNRGKQHVRYVLPDWDFDTKVPRGGWIAIDANGAIKRYNIAGHEIL
ncbi:MAG: UDP-2,3-diacylglucosamine diphosphatase [Glaciimonas sp.]|nr:UDP-2,3-diacylglucosamine diphosphatase [Glaciimonas sp.]